MSRIEDAFRRAWRAGDSSSDAAVTSATDDRPGDRIEQSMLHQYAAEKRLAPREMARERRPSVVEGKKAVFHGLASFAPWLRDKVILSREMATVSLDQYHRLAAALHEIQSARGLKTLMVSSAVPQEGKTLTVTNLALTLSESYNRRVLLIDADLRRPAIHDAFGIPNDVGLADVVRDVNGSLTLIEVSPRLALVTAGRLNTTAPMAELTSDRLPIVIKQASSQFDWVLIDTPPAGVLPDAQLVARLADAILFVIAAGSTPYEVAQRAIAALGDRVIGTVLNRVDESGLTGTNYYQRHYAQATTDAPLRR
jgi:capsular exopolysaccharide synthesis family protein